ncbi:Aldo/keto reductase [Vararia minispora EC-137]|uniref:Aldo/keto reductase n=1 Tax=Vararia minispora EC-137 TaxID=1314806 RepID=A0ACB8QTG4_9AGAM|nr:Aldo/keto reductase [Vararia minispora EC-137]
MAEQKSVLNIVMGAMTFGREGTEGARIHTPEGLSEVLDVFQKHGHTEIDTARVYTQGTSEELLGKIDHKGRGLLLETKLYPRVVRLLSPTPLLDGVTITHEPEDLRKFLDASLKALSIDQLEMWYLHGPDRKVPYEVTLKAVNDLYKEGKFKRFGISNYASWEVAEIVMLCRANGWIQPTVYQGIYNAIHRGVEPELFPCLRKFGLSFYAFNALAGGFFTGKYSSIDGEVPAGTRFDPSKLQGRSYRGRYWKGPYFEAIDIVRAGCEKHGLTMAEVALRWISNHSQLKQEKGDAVIIGASSVGHLEQNLVDLEKGPLPEDMLKVLDEAWATVKPHASNYWH